MIIQVQIQNAKASEVISAIKLLKGVKNVQAQNSKKAMKKENLEIVWSKTDEKAWKKAREELERGEAISMEQMKKELGL